MNRKWGRQPPRDWSRCAATFAAFAICVAVSGCAGKATASQGVHPGGYRGGDGAVKLIPAASRVSAPVLAGEDLNGDPLSTDAWPHKVLVVNFWASWCAPCVAEAPTLAQVARDLAPRGVRFLGVDFRNDDRGNAQAFERRYNLGYPSLYDPSSETVLAMPSSARPIAIPTTVVVDRQRRIAAVIYGGPVLFSTLEPLVRQIASEPT